MHMKTSIVQHVSTRSFMSDLKRKMYRQLVVVNYIIAIASSPFSTSTTLALLMKKKSKKFVKSVHNML